MKKILLLAITVLVFLSPLVAKDKKEGEKKQTIKEKLDLNPIDPGPDHEEEKTSSDSNWKESGKNALEATGKFFKDVGSSIEESVNNAAEVKCYGTWVHETDNVKTTFICNKDGTMEIRQRENLDVTYWKGTFSNTIRALSFEITETGSKSALLRTSKKEIKETWIIRYFVGDDKNTIKIFSSYIPTDADGTDYSKGVVFTKD